MSDLAVLNKYTNIMVWEEAVELIRTKCNNPVEVKRIFENGDDFITSSCLNMGGGMFLLNGVVYRSLAQFRKELPATISAFNANAGPSRIYMNSNLLRHATDYGMPLCMKHIADEDEGMIMLNIPEKRQVSVVPLNFYRKHIFKLEKEYDESLEPLNFHYTTLFIKGIN